MCAFFLILFSLAASFAHAEDASIQWSPQSGAAEYQLEIKSGDTVVYDKRFPAAITKWEEGLPVGLYTYRIRALDGQKRPGDWSEPLSFIAPPPPPTLLLPPDRSAVVSQPRNGVLLKWNKIKGVSKYLLTVKPKQGKELSQVVKGERKTLTNLPLGEYTWLVRPVLHVKNLRGKQRQTIETEASEEWRFSLVDRELASTASVGEVRKIEDEQPAKLASFQASLLVAYQSSSRSNVSGQLSWVPQYYFSPVFGLVGSFGVSAFKKSGGGNYLALEYGIFASFYRYFEVGGGAQTWVSYGGTRPEVCANGIYPITAHHRVVAGYSLIFDDTKTHQFKLGLGMSF